MWKSPANPLRFGGLSCCCLSSVPVTFTYTKADEIHSGLSPESQLTLCYSVKSIIQI